MTCVVYKDIWSKKNNISPEEVAINSNKKFWFSCRVCDHEYEQRPFNKKQGSGCPFCSKSNSKICGNLDCKFCLKKSCYDYKDIWSDKNIKTPEMVSISNGKKFWFKCNICNHVYEQSPGHKTQGSGCPYCSNQKKCGTLDCLFCLKKSCYDYKDIWSIKNIKKSEEVAISSNEKFWFMCHICNHEYEQTPGHKTHGRGCPFCTNIKICGTLDCRFCLLRSCYVYKDIWSVKNIKPETVAVSSGKKFWFNCLECKEEYEQPPNCKSQGNGCPFCVNKTELKVIDYLKEINVNFTRQYKIGIVRKFYDFYFPDHKLIIEVDGPQHFQQVSNWGNPEETLENDIKKMKTALVNGISVIRIYQPDIWSDKIDWKKFIKENLYMRTVPIVKISASDPEIYNKHINFL
jgi:very-short-patch-repair endonuclease